MVVNSEVLGRQWGVTALMGIGVSFWGDEYALELDRGGGCITLSKH